MASTRPLLHDAVVDLLPLTLYVFYVGLLPWVDEAGDFDLLVTFFSVAAEAIRRSIRAIRNDRIDPTWRHIFRVGVVGEIGILLGFFFANGVRLFPQIAEDIAVGITKIDVSNFRIGVVSLKFFVLMLILLDIGWSIETPQSNAHHPMATLAWSAVHKSPTLTLVMIFRTISILFNWTGSSNACQAEELPL